MHKVVLLVLIAACGSSGGGASSGTIGPGGGTLALDGIAVVEFPSGTFPSGADVFIEQTMDPVTIAAWDESSPMFQPGPVPYFVNVVTSVAPTSTARIRVELFAPDAIGPAVLASGFAYAITGNDGADQELLEQFELVEPADRSGSSLTIAVPGAWFGERHRGAIEGVFAIAAGIDDAFPRSSSADGCGAMKLSSPLRTALAVTSPFSPDRDLVIGGRPTHGHPGVDLRAADGTDLFAVGTGEVLVSMKSESAGEMVTLAIPGVGVVRYMHMQTGSRRVQKGDIVCEGEKIGKSDTTGALVIGPHLHFEFAPTGSAKIDPFPCIDPAKKPTSLGGSWGGSARAETTIPFTGTNIGIHQTLTASLVELVPLQAGGMKVCNTLVPKAGQVQLERTETYASATTTCTATLTGTMQLTHQAMGPSSLSTLPLPDGRTTYTAAMQETMMVTRVDTCQPTSTNPTPVGWLTIPFTTDGTGPQLVNPDVLGGVIAIPSIPGGTAEQRWDFHRTSAP